MVALQEKEILCTLEEVATSDRQLFYCATRRRSQERELREQLGGALAEFICECLEPEMIRTIIQKEFHYQYSQEVMQIEDFTQRLLESSVWEHAKVIYANRREKLRKQLIQFLKENPVCALDGFARFRMKTYRQALVTCVKDAVNEYLVDKEYKEFIQMLRYFVSVQSPKLERIHVIQEGPKQFKMLQEDGSPICLKEMDHALQEAVEQTFSHEDYIVSTLLTVAPAYVSLHARYPEENVIRTLMQVFEGRIVVCEGCVQCEISLNFHGDA